MIEFKGVRFRYDNEGPEALQGVDLEIPDGIFLVVAGHNGSGKSTLSKHINGLLLPLAADVLAQEVEAGFVHAHQADGVEVVVPSFGSIGV